MSPRRRETFEPVTLDQIRVHRCRDLLVYCSSVWCNHSATLNADWLPGDTPLRSLCPRMVCTACGLIGADVRPDCRRTRTGGLLPEVALTLTAIQRQYSSAAIAKLRFWASFTLNVVIPTRAALESTSAPPLEPRDIC